jgi:hypothetical protein
MKIKEILSEGGTGSLAPAVARAMPTTWELPNLPNQDPYLQYRMGLALASARTQEPYNTESAFGENMSIVGYTDADDETVQLALKLIGKDYAAGAHSIATRKSQEATDVNKQSPFQPKGAIKLLKR